MIPWVQLDKTTVPGGGGELRLMRRGAEFAIMLGRTELMNSRRSGSEKALATLSCARLQDRQRPHLLIGGLGMGFTLRAALAELSAEAQVTVAELVPAVVAWARGPLAEIFAGSLGDARVEIHEGDVSRLIKSATAVYDAILLDVDNGPEGLTSSANDALYDLKGLTAARAALRPGGVLAVWSVGADRNFTQRLGQAGFRVEEHKVRAQGSRHMIWVAARPGATAYDSRHR